MTKPGRPALVLLSSLLLTVLALPALATEEEPPPDTSEETVVTTDIEPAVEVTTPLPDTAPADWTYRYLVPTGIALAILLILATSGRYFTNVVRKRYRIVEE